MFGIGLPEMMVIAVVALVFIGPDKLPGVLRSLGKGLVELKRATNDVRATVSDEMHKIEEEIELKEVRKSAEDLGKEFGGVANKMDSLSLSKMSTGEQLESIADVLDKSEKNKAEKPTITEETEAAAQSTTAEVTSTKPEATGLTPEDFPAPENKTVDS